ncbi:MAG: ABC transporter ATP-binding protein [Candidatus Paceibacteria bacterium]
MKPTDKTIPKTPLAFMWFGLRPNRPYFFMAAVFVICAAFIHQLSPYLLKLIVDAFEEGNLSAIPFIMAVYPVSYFFIQTIYRCAGFSIGRVCIGGKEYLYNHLTLYILGHSHQYFSDRFAGSVMGKVSNAANSFEGFIEYALWNYLDSLVVLVSAFIFISLVSVNAGLIMLLLVIFLITFNYLLAGRAQQYAKVSADTQSKQSGVIVDIISNANVVRQFKRLPEESKSVAVISKQAKQAELKTRFFGEWMLLGNGLLITAGFGAIMWFLLQDWQAELITTGSIVFVIGLLMGMGYQLLFLGNAFVSGSQQFGQLKDSINELLVPHDIVDQSHASTLTVPHGKIEWNKVNFEYGENKVFHDFTLTIPAGQRLGLVGQSGAGKSTFVSLLLRQHDLTNGSIMIDGQKIDEVTQDSLRANIAVVPQEPSLFHRTIRENIAYGKPDATDEEIIAVAKKAFAHDFIDTLPQKYDTLVGERGVKLSGGQKQRIAIARAMLKDAPILILDEATSALDSESEMVIQKALHILMAGKTVIAIAHRLSTLREMDRIIVLDSGKIIEDGAHDALLAYDGTYAKLWQHQAGGFVGE